MKIANIYIYYIYIVFSRIKKGKRSCDPWIDSTIQLIKGMISTLFLVVIITAPQSLHLFHICCAPLMSCSIGVCLKWHEGCFKHCPVCSTCTVLSWRLCRQDWKRWMYRDFNQSCFFLFVAYLFTLKSWVSGFSHQSESVVLSKMPQSTCNYLFIMYLLFILICNNCVYWMHCEFCKCVFIV